MGILPDLISKGVCLMKIKKHGKEYVKEPSPKVEKFVCNECGCEFTALEDEYYVDYCGAEGQEVYRCYSTVTYTWSNNHKDYLVCSCPECHKIIKKIRERENKIHDYYTCTTTGNITLDGTLNCGDITATSASNLVTPTIDNKL